ncbi:MAG TPA: glycine cleavage T C-terminal barrel domain-containing protein [Acidimicrobiales bacterium]|nr:glycine cleavage T C-terminal barrel domain-containing protein [Acidimicrobiales bacterium]
MTDRDATAGPPAPVAADDYAALRDDVGAVELRRDVLRASGPDALAFLEGQLSQEVDLPPGGSAWSFLLQPQGKVVALVRFVRRGDDEFLLDTDGGWGAAVLERLQRYKLRVKCDLEALDWRCVALRGPRAAEVSPPADGDVVVATAEWPGWPGVDLLGPAPAFPPGVRPCPEEAYEIVRIEAGVPAMGSELDERTIPAEAGIVPQTVSFTKGCFTGQELVARIDSRGGNVPRHLRGVIVAAESPPPVGAAVQADGKDVGSLTSVGVSPGLGAPVALAYVGRAVAPPAEVTLAWEGGSAPARVETLPLRSGPAGRPLAP